MTNIQTNSVGSPQHWVDIPNYSLYEANREGQVRLKSDRTLLELDNHGFYTLKSDRRGRLQPIDKPWLLFLAFGIEDLSLLDRHKNSSFINRWHLYRHLRDTDGVLEKLLSDDYSSRWNEFFADVKEYDDNLDDEGRFHASIDCYEQYSDGWHRTLQAAKTCINLGFATAEELKEKWMLKELVDLAYGWNDNEGGQYDVKDLTMDQAWDFMISYCSRPFKEPGDMFWGLFCLNDQWCGQGYPDVNQYVRSQPFEVLEQWIAHLKECGELEDCLQEGEFETLTHYKHYTPEWDERFKALVPGWEPWVSPYTWTVIPGFSRYEMTDEEDAKPWNVQVRSGQDIPQVPLGRRIDCDHPDPDGNPTETYNLKSDDDTYEKLTYQELLDRTYPRDQS